MFPAEGQTVTHLGHWDLTAAVVWHGESRLHWSLRCLIAKQLRQSHPIAKCCWSHSSTGWIQKLCGCKLMTTVLGNFLFYVGRVEYRTCFVSWLAPVLGQVQKVYGYWPGKERFNNTSLYKINLQNIYFWTPFNCISIQLDYKPFRSRSTSSYVGVDHLKQQCSFLS